MSTNKDDETRVILRKLAMLITAFYILFYIVSLILVASFGLDWDYLAKFPFRFDSDDFKPLRREDHKDDRDLPLGT